MSTDASSGIDPRNRPPRRPPLIRSQSDSNPSLTFPAPLQRFQKDPVPSPSSLLENYRPIPDANGLGASNNSPSRPPRNPARMVQERLITIQSPIPLLPARRLTMKSNRPRTATGTREEVTPWELHPPPDSYGEVMPKTPVVGGSAVEPISKRILRSPNFAHPGSSHGINTGISFPDISLLRRKSTGSKLQKSRPSSSHAPHTTRPLPTNAASPPMRQRSMGQLTRHSPKSPQATPRAVQKLPSRDALPEPPTFLENQTIPEGPSLSHSSSSTTTSSGFGPKSTSMTSSEIHRKHLNFSTADRTILEELKRNIQARASQFVTKGGGPVGLNMAELGVASTFSSGRVGGIGGGKRHHAYPKEEVPYPRSYEREVLDLDVWETLFCKQICGSLTWHEFEQPPTKVLDIGCGTGSWILDCARIWRQCHFVGLDIVPLHPDLKQVGSNELAQRITWIQENFLDGLPFPNEEFDFVHIKRIARGVPEDKWDFLFEEITRVMKPGGAFEMIEEDLFFPGRRDDKNSEYEDDANNWSQDSRFPISRGLSVGTSRNSVSSSIHRYSGVTVPSGSDISDIEHDLDSESLTSSAGSGSVRKFSSELVISPPNALTTSPNTVSPPSPDATAGTLTSPQSKKSVATSGREVGAIVEDEEGELRAGSGLGTPLEDAQQHDRFGTDSTIRPRSVTAPSSHPSERNQPPSLHDASTNNESSVPNPTNNKPPISLLLRSAVSSSNVSHDFQLNLASLHHRKAALILHHPSVSSSGVPSPERLLQSGSDKVASVSPFVLRQLPKPPVNPRDHSLLETIYNEMHSSRFINLSPLSILPNTLSLHFKDVRTHAPLQFRFPPRVIHSGTGLRTDDQAHDPRYHPDSIDDENEVRDAIPSFSVVTALPWVRGHSAVSSEKQFFLSKTPPENLDPKYPKEDECDRDNFLTMRSLVKGTSPYVSLDDSRPTAFSPSARASFLKSPSKQRIKIPLSDTKSLRSPDSPGSPKATPFAIAASISMLRNSLPNQKLHVDLRSLNLHLWARVAEILACTETMWEWVLDYQRKMRAEKATRTQRARSKSVDVHPRFIAPSPEATSDRLKAAISLLTRQEYEDLLLRFYMDMQDHIGIEHAIQKRFGWRTLRTSPTTERKSFDDACKQYVLWKQDQQARRGERPPTATPRTRSRPLSASYASNFSPLDSFTSMSQEALQLEGLPVSSDGTMPNFTSRSSTGTSKDRVQRERSSSYTAPKSQTSHVPSEPHRLSRAMRVFVAWKAD
ncbi:hypothetical protein L218DRAFT_995627 [Marasmius fiardii PR-910]|nr:hypothetical protein L218DRAFT_995627 [Marasmius fiardii PR-910]